MQTSLLHFLLSRLDPRAAPIVMRLGQLNRWPSLRVAAIITLTIASISSIAWIGLVLLLDRLSYNSAFRLTMLWLGMFSAMALIAVPSGIASACARLTGRDVRSQEFSLLRLTTLTAHALVHGYFGAALLRRRLFLSVLAGLIPNVIGFAVTLYIESRWQPVVLVKMAVVFSSIAAILHLIVVGGLAGAALALVLRSESLAALLTSFGCFIPILIVIGTLFYAVLTDTPVGVLLSGIGLLLIPYGAAKLMLRSKWRWIDRILTKYPGLSVEV